MLTIILPIALGELKLSDIFARENYVFGFAVIINSYKKYTEPSKMIKMITAAILKYIWLAPFFINTSTQKLEIGKCMHKTKKLKVLRIDIFVSDSLLRLS